MNQLLLSFLISGIAIPTILVGVFMSVNYDNYKYYKPTYDAIKNCSYVMITKSFNIETYKKPEDNNFLSSSNQILFFVDFKRITSIKLLSQEGNHYIHNSSLIFDPYAYYWFRKIKRARLNNNQMHQGPQRRGMSQRLAFFRESNVIIGKFKFFRG